MKVRPGSLRLTAVVLVAVLLGVAVSLTLWLAAPGLFGLADDVPSTAVVAATVTQGTGCTDATGGEIVTFVHEGKQHQAKLDACGHREGEPVDVSVPAGAGPGVTVRAAEAATGERDTRRPVAFVLFLLACCAGGGFAWLAGKVR